MYFLYSSVNTVNKKRKKDLELIVYESKELESIFVEIIQPKQNNPTE